MPEPPNDEQGKIALEELVPTKHGDFVDYFEEYFVKK